MAADCLHALRATMSSSVKDWPTAWRVHALCQLVSTYFDLCTTGTPDMLEGFWPCPTLLLRCGAAAQRFVAQQVQHGAAMAQRLCSTLGVQVWALTARQLAASRLADCAQDTEASNAVAAVAQACAPPALLQKWLQCTLASVRLLKLPAWKPGGQLGAGGQLGCSSCPNNSI